MFAFQRFIRSLAAAAAVLTLSGLTAFGGAAGAARAQATTPKFGMIDLERVFTESKGRQKNELEFQGSVGQLDGVLKRLQENNARFLPDAQIKELAALYEKKTPTPDEKKRMSQLEDTAALQLQQKRRLENTAAPTDDENKQLAAIGQNEQRGQNALRGINDAYRQRLEVRRRELTAKFITEIRGVVAKIAQEKGLAAVFTTEMAFYTGNDITEDVIKQINK